MAAMTRIKRGSMQIQRAAIKAGGRIGARNLMMVIVVFGLILSGLVQHSATVALMALSDPLSSADFAEYVANTSYVTRYCAPINNMSQNQPGSRSSVKPPLKPYGQSAGRFRKPARLCRKADWQAVYTDCSFQNLNWPALWPYRKTEDLVYLCLCSSSFITPSPMRSQCVAVNIHWVSLVPLLEEESVDSLLREIFLWGTFISPLPSSRLAARIGPKRIIGPALLADGLLLLLVPLAWFTPYHVAIRFVQGVFTGATWPALHMLAASWFPPLQRSGFISCYSGTALAGLLGTPLVLAAGRDSLCYILASLTSLWFLAWWRFVYDTPGEHPSLPEHKKKHLETAIGNKLTARSATPPLPWRHLLSSAPVWACAVACLGNQWGQTTLQLAVTKYLKLVYGFSLTCDRVLSVLPHIGYFMAALLFGRVVDHVRSQPLVSTTTARKLFVYISHFFPAAMLFVVGYSGCDPSFPAALYTAAVMTSGATPSGSYTSAVDIAPNYAGYQTFGAAGSLVGNYVITEGLHGSLPGSWRLVFGVASGVLVLTAVFFMSVGSGSVQHWNNLRDRQERQSQGSLAATDSRRSSGPRRGVESRTWVDRNGTGLKSVSNWSLAIVLAAAECKEKWRNLRTVFSRKLKPPPSGSGRKKKAYYLADAMQFCVPFIKALAPLSSGNLPQIPHHETTEEIFENLERCDDESGSLEDSSDMVQSSQASSPPPPPPPPPPPHLIQSPSTFPPASPEGTVLPQPNRSKKSLSVRNKSVADTDKCVAEYFKAKKARLETTANVEATSSHKIERKEALKMFLLSLISEIEKFTDSQIKLFKRHIFSVIDKISTSSLLHSLSFITIDSPQSDSTHTSGISHTAEPSHTTAISPVSESLQEQASPTHQFYTDFAGALNSNYYKMLKLSFPGDASGPHAAAIAALLAGRRSSLGDRRGSLQYRSSLEAVKEAEQTELEEFMDDHENLSLYLDHGLSQNSLLRKRTGSTSSRRTVISSETQTILEELTSPEGEADAAVITTVVVTRAQVERGGDQDEPTVEGRTRTEEQTKGGKKEINVQTAQL
uniref:Major facilitator superfamily (MFS) profile domain-containing protein n=1 Tax=Timema poppense TaxID=170557 RepID=A0A7R9CVS1_TIMPO|nr:unnamed protein product [Timema poppensis]